MNFMLNIKQECTMTELDRIIKERADLYKRLSAVRTEKNKVYNESFHPLCFSDHEGRHTRISIYSAESKKRIMDALMLNYDDEIASLEKKITELEARVIIT